MLEKESFGISMLVLLYNKEIDDCSTLRSIAACANCFGEIDFNVVIWNNGPKKLNLIDSKIFEKFSIFDRCSVDVVDTIENTPLSIVYNNFIERTNSDWYLFLDDDSELSGGFFDEIFSEKTKGFHFITPVISSGGVNVGPNFCGNIVNFNRDVLISGGDKVFFIGSGLVLSSNLIKKLKMHYSGVFDESYAFYGVDTSFGLRLMSIAKTEKIKWAIRGVINHSLSRLIRMDKVSAARRRRERGIDLGITIRRYPSINWIVLLLKIFVERLIVADEFSSASPSLRWVLHGFFAGIHPRCLDYRRNKIR